MDVLIVDDTPAIRFLLEEVVKGRGHNITSCGEP